MMKVRFVQILCLTAFVFAIPVLATAERRQRACSARQIAGDWAYSKTGTLTLPNGVTVAFGAVGRITVEPDGTLSGTQDNNIGGNAGKGLLSGTSSLKRDCTTTMDVDVLDATTGALRRTVSMSGVFDQDASSLRLLVTRLVLPNGGSLPQVVPRICSGTRSRRRIRAGSRPRAHAARGAARTA